ncbi:MAG: heme ABC exporter ATP-binding protein CcmA [Candidatus Binatia bacterium]
MEIRGLERRFGPLRVLRGVDLEVSNGQILALFGANGAGKTTLLRAVVGLIRPDRGSICVLGHELPGNTALRRRIGMIGHESFLYGDLTSMENLRYYARLYGVEEDTLEESLAEVELSHVADRPVRAFSRGMLQRLSLARAILHRPELLVLDEPFTGLDPHGSALLERIIAREQQRGTTVIMTTHDIEVGLRVCGRAVLLHEGRVAWDGGNEIPTPRQMREVYDRFVMRTTGAGS